MSHDLREFTVFFKDRLDELCLLEGRIEKQAEALSVVSKKCISANEAQLNNWLLRMDNAVEDTHDISQAAKKIDAHISFCTQHVKLALGIFFGSLILAGCIWVGTYLWYQHVSNQVADIKAEAKEARLELAQTNVKLKNKPLFLPAGSNVDGNKNDYVRIVPNTEATMSHADGDDYPGVYAKIWHR